MAGRNTELIVQAVPLVVIEDSSKLGASFYAILDRSPSDGGNVPHLPSAIATDARPIREVARTALASVVPDMAPEIAESRGLPDPYLHILPSSLMVSGEEGVGADGVSTTTRRLSVLALVPGKALSPLQLPDRTKLVPFSERHSAVPAIELEELQVIEEAAALIASTGTLEWRPASKPGSLHIDRTATIINVLASGQDIRAPRIIRLLDALGAEAITRERDGTPHSANNRRALLASGALQETDATEGTGHGNSRTTQARRQQTS